MSSRYLDDATAAFRTAAGAFAEILDRPEVATAWGEASALPGYSVGAIVCHVNAAIGWTQRLLDEPAALGVPPMPRQSLLRFAHALKIDSDGSNRHPAHDVLREQCEKAASHGWASSRAKFGALVDRLSARLEGESADRLVDLRPTAPLVIQLGDWLPTRVVELVVHGDDIAVSVGIDPPMVAPHVATLAVDVLVAVAREAHGDLAVIRALARRERADAAVFPVF